MARHFKKPRARKRKEKLKPIVADIESSDSDSDSDSEQGLAVGTRVKVFISPKWWWGKVEKVFHKAQYYDVVFSDNSVVKVSGGRVVKA